MFDLSSAVGLPETATLAIVVVACTPGGSFSNIVALPFGANSELTAMLTVSEMFLSLLLLPIGEDRGLPM